jgi:starvation-inducible DNA-binding protein
MTNMNIGIGESERKNIAEGLLRFLAETYAVYTKTHNFHWNVTGPMFDMLHKMFEEHYNEMWNAIDEIAERVRILGSTVPEDFARLSTITTNAAVPDSNEMIRQLVEGHETVIRTAREMIPMVQDAEDEATAGLLTDRMEIHEKTTWMLRSLIS